MVLNCRTWQFCLRQSFNKRGRIISFSKKVNDPPDVKKKKQKKTLLLMDM